jgi:hypothetical protein
MDLDNEIFHAFPSSILRLPGLTNNCFKRLLPAHGLADYPSLWIQTRFPLPV